MVYFNFIGPKDVCISTGSQQAETQQYNNVRPRLAQHMTEYICDY